MLVSRTAAGTLLSRASGLVRDMLFAYVFGTSGQYDAYIVAISVPFLLRNVFAEGGLSSAFIPIYQKKDKSNAFATRVFILILVVVGIISTLIAIFPSEVVGIFAGGLKTSSFGLATKGVRITAFFLLFISLWSWGAGILNSHGSFFVPALSPMFNNLFIIGALLISLFFHRSITVVCVGFMLGGLFQFVFEVPFLKKIGFRFELSKKRQEMTRFARTFALTSLAVSLGQINLFVDTNVASRLATGSISMIQYANRLYQLPIGILVISLATVYLPEMSTHFKISDLKNSIHEAFSKLFYIVIPSTVFFALFAYPVVNLVYGHGKFSSPSVLVTSQVLAILMIGFPFRAVVIIMNRAFYAFENANLAAWVTAIGVLVNTVGDLTLGFTYSVRGLVASTTLSSIVTALVVYTLGKKKYNVSFLVLKDEMIKISIAVLISTFVSFPFVLITNSFLSVLFGFTTFFSSFILLSIFFKSENASNILSVLNRKRKKQ